MKRSDIQNDIDRRLARGRLKVDLAKARATMAAARASLSRQPTNAGASSRTKARAAELRHVDDLEANLKVWRVEFERLGRGFPSDARRMGPGGFGNLSRGPVQCLFIEAASRVDRDEKAEGSQ